MTTIRIMFCDDMTNPEAESIEVAEVKVVNRLDVPIDPLSYEIIKRLPEVVGGILEKHINSPHSSLWVKVE